MGRPTVIIVRDGWGKSPLPQWDNSNAIVLAKHPVADRLMASYPWTLVHTSGFDVGLPEGTMGNSEVGHQNIGAGRIVDQESVAITKQVRNGEFYDNLTLVAAAAAAAKSGAALHLIGIVSDAGVHGQLEHLYACLELAKRRGVHRVFLHALTDGRDTSPHSGIRYIAEIEAKMAEIGVGKIATVSGRFYAMDRDNRWERVQKAYDVMVHGQGAMYASATAAVQAYYNHPIAPNMSGDEFVVPCIISDDAATPRGLISPNDVVIFYNYRGDRPRELTRAFVEDEFKGFTRGSRLPLHFVTLTAYEQGLPVQVAYPKPAKMHNTLGDYLSVRGLKQFRCAETEKFPHVTFFFNDYREQPWPGEDRYMAQSPKDVRTYDLKPEMAAADIARASVEAIRSGQYALVVVNFANCDMVGHTGVLAAAIEAVQYTDAAVGQLVDAALAVGGSAIVLADHGNAEQMIDPETGGPHTAHTTFDVELIVVDEQAKGRKLRQGGRLADVAPTALELMGLPVPPEMTGTSLLV